VNPGLAPLNPIVVEGGALIAIGRGLGILPTFDKVAIGRGVGDKAEMFPREATDCSTLRRPCGLAIFLCDMIYQSSYP